MNVLLVSAGGFQGLSLLSTLRASRQVRVLIADAQAEHVTGYFADDVFRVPPLAEREELERALRDLCGREDVRIVFPCTQRELPLLAELSRSGALGSAHVAVSSPELLSRVLDKRTFYAWVAEQGLPHLAPVSLASATDVELPLFLKPRVGWGGASTRVVKTSEELARARRELPEDEYVVQPYLADAHELSADFAIDWRGEVSPIVLRTRTRVSGGFAVIAESAEDAPAQRICERTARALGEAGGRGLFNAQLLVQNGRHFVSDLNPRFGTSACFGAGVGVNPPLFLCASLDPTIRPDHEPPYRTSAVKMVRSLTELFVPRISALERCSGVLFDLDDTLFDQKTWIADKLVLTFEALERKLGVGRAQFLEAGLLLLEHGRKKHLLDELIAALGVDASLRDELLAAYRAATPSAAPPYPDVLDALARLKRMGLSLGLLTDNPPDSQRQKLRASGLDARLDVVVFSRELGAEKPAPETYLEACRRLGHPPERTCMVGDDFLRDVVGSARAGLCASFLVRRPGVLTNAAPELARRVLGPTLDHVRFAPIASLRELVHAFRYVREEGC